MGKLKLADLEKAKANSKVEDFSPYLIKILEALPAIEADVATFTGRNNAVSDDNNNNTLAFLSKDFSKNLDSLIQAIESLAFKLIKTPDFFLKPKEWEIYDLVINKIKAVCFKMFDFVCHDTNEFATHLLSKILIIKGLIYKRAIKDKETPVLPKNMRYTEILPSLIEYHLLGFQGLLGHDLKSKKFLERYVAIEGHWKHITNLLENEGLPESVNKNFIKHYYNACSVKYNLILGKFEEAISAHKKCINLPFKNASARYYVRLLGENNSLIADYYIKNAEITAQLYMRYLYHLKALEYLNNYCNLSGAEQSTSQEKDKRVEQVKNALIEYNLSVWDSNKKDFQGFIKEHTIHKDPNNFNCHFLITAKVKNILYLKRALEKKKINFKVLSSTQIELDVINIDFNKLISVLKSAQAMSAEHFAPYEMIVAKLAATFTTVYHPLPDEFQTLAQIKAEKLQRHAEKEAQQNTEKAVNNNVTNNSTPLAEVQPEKVMVLKWGKRPETKFKSTESDTLKLVYPSRTRYYHFNLDPTSREELQPYDDSIEKVEGIMNNPCEKHRSIFIKGEGDNLHCKLKLFGDGKGNKIRVFGEADDHAIDADGNEHYLLTLNHIEFKHK